MSPDMSHDAAPEMAALQESVRFACSLPPLVSLLFRLMSPVYGRHQAEGDIKQTGDFKQGRKMSTNVYGFANVVSGACAARAKARMPAAAVDIMHLC